MHKSILTAAFAVTSACYGSAAYADPQEKHGDWTFSVFQAGKDKLAEASITSSGPEKLHKQCSTSINACVWSVTIASLKCKKGDEFVFLANSNAGAAAFKATCFPSLTETTNRMLILGEVGGIDEMAKAGTFAFAFPNMRAPFFNVAAFSGNGASVALQKLDDFSSQAFKQGK